MDDEQPKRRLKRTLLLKDTATAVSLANLFFLGAWMPVLDKSFNQRLKFTLFNFNNLFGLILDVGLLAAVFLVPVAVVRVSGREQVTQVARVLFLFVCGSRRRKKNNPFFISGESLCVTFFLLASLACCLCAEI